MRTVIKLTNEIIILLLLLFNAVKTIKKLKKYLFLCWETIRQQRKCIQSEFRAKKAEKTMLSGFSEDVEISILSYTPKKIRNVLMSTLSEHQPTHQNRNEKPDPILLYNKMKNGVDEADKLKGLFIMWQGILGDGL